jgi:hypothetical protein
VYYVKFDQRLSPGHSNKVAQRIHRNYPPKTLNDTKTSEANRLIRLRFKLSLYDALVLQLGLMAKVNEKTELKSAGF